MHARHHTHTSCILYSRIPKEQMLRPLCQKAHVETLNGGSTYGNCVTATSCKPPNLEHAELGDRGVHRYLCVREYVWVCVGVCLWVCVRVCVCTCLCVGVCGRVLVCAGVCGCLCVGVRRGGLSEVALGWARMGWNGLGSVGLAGFALLLCAGLRCAGLGWAELHCAGFA